MVYQANKTDSGAQVFWEVDGEALLISIVPSGEKKSIHIAHRKENMAQRNVQDTSMSRTTLHFL